MNNGNAPICMVHNVQMTWKEGVSKKTNQPYAFWSCNVKNPDNSFCSYKPPKPEPQTQSSAGAGKSIKLLEDILAKLSEISLIVGDIDKLVAFSSRKTEEPKSQPNQYPEDAIDSTDEIPF